MKLIVNADDFGLSKAINFGIVESHLEGIVTSTSMMITMPAVKHAKSLAKNIPDLGIGPHLNISLGKPLTNCKTLLKADGTFYKPKEKPDQDSFSTFEIYEEFLAQYKLFLKIMKRKPTHFDSHLYTHQKYKKAKEAVIKLALEVQVPIRDIKIDGFEEVEFLSWFKYQKGIELQKEFEKRIVKLQRNKIYELMVHPAFLDDELYNSSSYTVGRLVEYEILTNPATKKLLIDEEIKLINFSHIGRQNV